MAAKHFSVQTYKMKFFCTFKKQKCHVKQTRTTMFFSIRLTLQGIKYPQFLLTQKRTLNELASCRVTPFVK